MSDVATAMTTTLPGLRPTQEPAAPKKRAARKKAAAPAAKKRKAKKKAKAPATKAAATTRRGRRAALSMDLGAALDLAGSLHRTDMPIFQAISNALSQQGGPSRKRILAAIGKVFG